MASICEKIKIPRIIGMLVTGIILGPYVLDFLDSSILNISSELRKMALIIILIKAGLSLDLKDLKKVGRPALLMSFLPATFEIIAYVIFAPILFGVSRVEAALIGAVLSAVSPAVVVPRMVDLMDNNLGTKKGIPQGIPQMILAGASFDDVFVIVLFSTFLAMNQGEGVNLASFADIPISIVSGILIGAVVGLILYRFFEYRYNKEHLIRNSTKVIIILAVSFLLVALEDYLKGRVAMSGLLAITSMALVIAMKSTNIVKVRLQEKFGKIWIAAEVVLFVLVGAMSGLLAITSMALVIAMKSTNIVKVRLQEKFGKIWIAAEVVLFVLVGAAVDIRYTMSAGFTAVVMIFIALAIRSIGVFICMIGTELNSKERLFCVFSYIPKATVQAAIGSVPLAAGLPCGKLVLSIAVLAIIITAPIGAFLIDFSKEKLLS